MKARGGWVKMGDMRINLDRVSHWEKASNLASRKFVVVFYDGGNRCFSAQFATLTDLDAACVMLDSLLGLSDEPRGVPSAR
jgi:hypothetical protein